MSRGWIGLGLGVALGLASMGSVKAAEPPQAAGESGKGDDARAPAAGDGWIVLSVAACVHGELAHARMTLAREEHFHMLHVSAFPNNFLFHRDFEEEPQTEEARRYCQGDTLGGQLFVLRAPPGTYHFMSAEADISHSHMKLYPPRKPFALQAGHTVYVGEFLLVPHYLDQHRSVMPLTDRLTRDIPIAEAKTPDLVSPGQDEDLVAALIADSAP